jgi:hypothetical protein
MSCALQSRPRARLDSHACSDGRSESICICTQTTESAHRKPTPASPRHTAHPRLRSAHSSLYVNYSAHSHTEVHSQPKCHGESTRKQQNSQSSCESAPWATLQHSSSPPCPLCPTSHVRSKMQRRDHKDDAWALEIRSAQLCVAQGTAPLFLHHCGSPSQPKLPVKP